MTRKERMLRTLRGEPTDRIPWAPRLDLWYRAQRHAGTLPERFRDASLLDVADDLGWSHHAVIPPFRDLRSPADDADRALGLYNLWTMPCHTVLEDVERAVRVEGDRTFIEYRTPGGVVTATVLYDETMRAAGVSITHVESQPFKTPDDYATLRHIFDNLRVVANREGYDEFAASVGDRGLAVGYLTWAGSPMHLIQRDLMPLDVFFYEMHDRPDEVRRLADSIGRYYEAMLEVALESPAEVLLLGANYDASVTYPPFFAEHIRPWLKRYADALHARGKYLLTHADGENTGLLEHYVGAGVDIADSVCPKPMTRLSLREARDAFDGRVTIMGGVPSVALLPETMDDAAFDAFLDDFFEQVGDGDHLILGVSDTTPPQADLDRLRNIAERVEAFGAVGRSEA